jgi:hypothetical protein
LRKGESKKSKDLITVESKIEETGRNIIRMEKILSEMKSNPQGAQGGE